MMNSTARRSGAEPANQRGRSLTAGYAVKRLSVSLSPRDRRESGRAVPRGAHRARSALSASTRESTVATRAAREGLGVLGRNGEAPSDRSLGASVYRPSPSVGDERKMAPEEGFEPPTRRLTAACSTTELLRKSPGPRANLEPVDLHQRAAGVKGRCGGFRREFEWLPWRPRATAAMRPQAPTARSLDRADVEAPHHHALAPAPPRPPPAAPGPA